MLASAGDRLQRGSGRAARATTAPQEYQAAGAGDRKALVIGNAAYRSVNALKNPGNDANDLGDVLNSLHFQVTRVHDADSSTLRKSVNDFAGGLHAGDIAVFFFAGHGMEVDGANYLVPVDFAPSNQADAEHDCYRADRARELIEKSGARVTILILDACRNNPFAAAGHRGGAAYGLAPMDPGLGTLIAYSTGPGQVADDNQTGRNGLFTKYLLEQMREPVDVIALFRKTRELVYQASGRRQRPWVHEDLIDTLYLTPQQPSGAPPASLQTSRAPQVAKEDPLAKGQLLFNKGDYTGAQAEFERATRADPENPYAHNALGAAYSRLTLMNPAVMSFNMAISLKPDYAAAYYNRGLAYLSVGDNAHNRLAIEDFTWAIGQESSDPVLYHLRGRANFAIREYDDALADYNQAIELDPNDAAFYRDRAELHRRQGNQTAAAEDESRSAQLSRPPRPK